MVCVALLTSTYSTIFTYTERFLGVYLFISCARIFVLFIVQYIPIYILPDASARARVFFEWRHFVENTADSRLPQNAHTAKREIQRDETFEIGKKAQKKLLLSNMRRATLSPHTHG